MRLANKGVLVRPDKMKKKDNLTVNGDKFTG